MRRLCWPRVASLLACAPLLADAATLTVTNLNDSGPGSLRERMAAAGNGDTIVFAVTGTITLSSGALVVDQSFNISGPGAGNLTIDRITPTVPQFRIFTVNGGGVTSTISGLTISRGQDGGNLGGGGILNSGTLTVNDCVFNDNISRFKHGGAIFNENTLTLNGCAFNGNRAGTEVNGGLGGAIFNLRNLTLNGCGFSSNQADQYGAIANYSNGETPLAQVAMFGCFFSSNPATAVENIAFGGPATATIQESTFVGNSGGAISNDALSGTATLTVERSIFASNAHGDGRGGGIANSAYGGTATATISASTLQDNSGGGIYHSVDTSSGGGGTANMMLSNSTLSGNTNANMLGGGGIFIETNSATGSGTLNLELTSCTLSRNGDPSGNGASIRARIFGGSVGVIVRNTILQRNVGASSVNFSNTGGIITSQGYNLSDDDGAGHLVGPGDQINTDPQLDPLGVQNNGGSTPTIALVTESPALDRGNNFGLTTDQRGAPRPVDIPSIPNATNGSDIGAYEAPADPVQGGSPSFVVTTVNDHNDGLCSTADCTLREAINRSNAVPGGNSITFAPGVTGTITLLTAVGGQLNITEGVAITGPGARFLKISAFTQSRVLVVSGSGLTTLAGLTIADGRVDNFNAGDSEGGGVHNVGTLALVDCTVDFNRALAGSGFMTGQNGGSARGGGVFNAGALTLTRCTFKGNGAGGGSGAAHPPPPITVGGSGGDGRGGAIYNDTGASLSIANCTFSSNFVYGGNGGSGTFGGNGGNALGSAIFNLGSFAADASTFSLNNGDPGLGGLGSNPGNNGAPGGGVGALSHGSGASTLRACIIAGNTATAVVRDAYGDFISGGFNLIGRIDGTTGFSAATDQSGTNTAPLSPQLGTLANNGGQTDTMSPLPGSPVVDKGNAFGLTTDQRGMLRPVDVPGIPNANGGDGSDIGAVELTPIFVTTVDDHNDGACTVGDCTLREAINLANTQSGNDTIAFAAGVSGTIQLGSELPQLYTSLVIAGPGANVVTVRRNTAPAYRIFVIANPPQNDPVVTITGLTIANGLAPNGGTPINSGGGIINDRSNLTVRDCVLTGNSSSAASFSYGGAIMNSEGHLTVDRCTFSANNAYYGGGIASRHNSEAGIRNITITNSTFLTNTAAYGGALMNEVQNGGRIANVGVTHCTFSGNLGSEIGGGIYNSGANNGTVNLTVSHCTFAGNAGQLGTSLYNFAFSGTATATLRNSIFAASGGANLFNTGGSLTSLGYNLSNDNGGFLNNTGDQTNTPPLLAPLANNGGPTQTQALLTGSPALDKGRSFFLVFDQRGFARAADSPKFTNASGGDGTDIGAFEVSPFGGIVDTDGDGMPDEFEVFFNLTDPNADMDGDGDTNLQEYLNGTDPCNNASFALRIISIVRNGNDIVITFRCVAGKTFRLERKDALTDLDWLSIPGVSDLTTPVTGNAQFTHTNGWSAGHGFYRVRLFP